MNSPISFELRSAPGATGMHNEVYQAKSLSPRQWCSSKLNLSKFALLAV